MNYFIASEDRSLFQKEGLASFEALWSLQLANVDEPNSERGGWSTVSYLTIGGKGYFLKRQSNHLTRSWINPWGEPTFAREFRNIQHYQQIGIVSVTAAFFATRIQGKEKQAILVTHALDDWQDLESYLPSWPQLSVETQQAIVKACAHLVKQLHDKGVLHGCFYPKHIFLRPTNAGFETCLIDLEKTRKLLFGKRDRIKDIDTLLRRTKKYWGETEFRLLLSIYLGSSMQSAEVNQWLECIFKRTKKKEGLA